MLRWEGLGFGPRRMDRAGSPGRCGQPSPSSVGPSPGRESHKGPVYIRVRSFSWFLFLSSFTAPASARCDTRYPRSRNFTYVHIRRVLSNTPVLLCNRYMKHRHSCSGGATKLPSNNSSSIRLSIRENIQELAREVARVQSCYRDRRDIPHLSLCAYTINFYSPKWHDNNNPNFVYSRSLAKNKCLLSSIFVEVTRR